MLSFSINRAEWGSGKLLRPDGRMCCLGHLSVACGVPKSELLNCSYPNREWTNVPKVFQLQSFADAMVSSSHTAARINDSPSMTWEDKEVKLIKLFKDNGIELSFHGEGYQP